MVQEVTCQSLATARLHAKMRRIGPLLGLLGVAAEARFVQQPTLVFDDTLARRLALHSSIAYAKNEEVQMFVSHALANS